jgi:integrase
LLAARGIDRLVEERRVVRGEVTHLSTVEHLMRAWYASWDDDPEAKDTTLRSYRQAARRVVHGLLEHFTPAKTKTGRRVHGLGHVRVARLDLNALERWKRDRLRHWVRLKEEEIAYVEGKLVEATEAAESAKGARREGRAVRRLNRLAERLEGLEARMEKPVLTTFDLDVKVLRAAWNWARERIDSFPRRSLPTGAVAPTEKELEEAVNDHRPSAEDFWKVVKRLDGWPKTACLLLAATGARKSEIAGATWRGFNPTKGTLTLVGKTGTRKAALPPRTVEMLLEMRPDGARGRILTEVTAGTVGSGLAQHIRTACEEAEVDYFCVHAIRRMVTDLLYESGNDPSAAAAQLGHSVKTAMKKYRKAKLKDKKRAVALAGLGAPPEQAKVRSLEAQRKKLSG